MAKEYKQVAAVLISTPCPTSVPPIIVAALVAYSNYKAKEIDGKYTLL